GRDRVSRRRELLFQAKRSQKMVARLPRETRRRCHSPFSPEGILKRCRETQWRSLHLASEIHARLGNKTSVRQEFRQLRLVRRADELHQFRRLRSESLNSRLSTVHFPRQMACAANHRQRHPCSGAWHLLVDYAARHRVPRRPNAATARSWLVEPWWRQNE